MSEDVIRTRRTRASLVALAMLSLVVPMLPMAGVGANEHDDYAAYVLEGTCDVIRSEPIAELGALGSEHEVVAELVEGAGHELINAVGIEATADVAIDALTASDHVVAVREVTEDRYGRVVACAGISDSGDTHDLALEAFGATGLVGRAILREADDGGTQVSVAVWQQSEGAAAEPERDMPEAPDFDLTLMDGETVSLSDYRGKTVLMIMWASWCPYCNAEFPMYEEMWQDYQEHGDEVVFLGVGLKNDRHGDAEGFLDKHGITFPTGRDTEGGSSARGEIESTLGVPGTPALFIITPDGHVYGAQFGVVSREDIEAAIGAASAYRDE